MTLERVPAISRLSACALMATALGLTACGSGGGTASPTAAAAHPVTTLDPPKSTTAAPTTTVAPTTTTIPISDPRIFLMGDSVMAALNPNYTDYARKTLGGLGWHVTIDAKESRFATAGIALLQSRRREIGQVVVIQMGNNYGGHEDIFGKQIDEMFNALAGVRKVVFLTVGEFRPDRREVNHELQAALARHPNMILADWNAVAFSDPSYLAVDSLHLTPRGAQALADLVASTVGPAPGYLPPPSTTTVAPLGPSG